MTAPISARPWYIQALKLGRRSLASLAAEGIAEIGDPDGESIPYLISALTFQTVREVATSAATVLDMGTLSAIQYQRQLNGQPIGPQPSSPVPTAPATVGGGILHGATGVLVGHGYVGPPVTGPTVTYPDGWRGGITGQPQPYVAYGIKDTGWPDIVTVSTPVTVQDIKNAPVRYSNGVDVQTNVNPGVYDCAGETHRPETRRQCRCLAAVVGDREKKSRSAEPQDGRPCHLEAVAAVESAPEEPSWGVIS